MKKLFPRLMALGLTLSLTLAPASALELDQAKELLADYYVDGVPQQVLELDSLDAILEALDDPYTVYLDPEEYEGFLQVVNGTEVVGIGVSIEAAFDDGFRIMSVLPDSPALEQGLQSGDRIVAVDGVRLTSAADPRTVISGEAGTSITVTVDRDGQELSFTMERRAVPIPIVTYDLVNGTAFISCTSFGASTSYVMEQAIRDLDDQTAVWIVDLRANPGGSSDSTAVSAGLFVGGQVMLYFRDSQDNFNYTFLRPDFPDLTDKPAILLTSAHSASGAELFAADLRDYRGGIALGQRTFGKGIAQIVFDSSNTQGFEEGEALKVTAYRFYSPKGTTNHIVGVLPTLLLSPEHTETAAFLLSQPEPSRPLGYLKLELAGYTFYINLEQAYATQNKDAFVELLEALPPSAVLYEGGVSRWTEIDPQDFANSRRLDFHPRTFSDVSGSPYEREILTLAAYDLLLGDGDGTLQPQKEVTRGELCAILANALNLPLDKTCTFTDVSSDAPYAGAVAAMTGMGFLSGRGDGTFHPDEVVTYQEMVTILSSVAAWASIDGYELSQDNLSAPEWVEYYDYAEWAQVPARNLDKLGALVDGVAPTDPVTREVVAGVLCRLMENLNLIWN